MFRLRRLRWFASLASLLLLVAMTAYAAHHHLDTDRSQGTEHCALCLQLGAAAGTPTVIAPLPIPVASAYALPPDASGVIPGRLFLRPLQARAPPQFLRG